jgi:hypothetical protein
MDTMEKEVMQQALAALETSWEMDAVASTVLPAIRAIRELLEVKRRGRRIHLGHSVHNFHSYRDFDSLEDANAYMWEMANIPVFNRCFEFQGLDGWRSNEHLKGKEFPPEIADKIKSFIEEDRLITNNWSEE